MVLAGTGSSCRRTELRKTRPGDVPSPSLPQDRHCGLLQSNCESAWRLGVAQQHGARHRMFNLPTQTKCSGPVASPFEEKVTCWQGDNTEPFVPPKAQRLVLTGMDTFQAWACRASLSSGIGSRLSGPRTQTPLSSMLDVGTRFTGEGLQWARSWDTRSLTATHHEHHSRGAGSGL